MTDEEKKAIENVKKQLEGIKKANECGLATKNEFKEDIESIETVLNLIQKQQAELEEWKIEYNHWCQLAIDRKKELEKKDKEIDEMAETLSAVCTGISAVREQFEKCYCEFINTDKDCCWKTDKSCKDCIIEYFEKKARNNYE